MTEYLVVDMGIPSTCREEEVILNSYSEEEWELVAVRIVTETTYDPPYMRYYFSRKEYEQAI